MPKPPPLYRAYRVDRLLEVCSDLRLLVQAWPADWCTVIDPVEEYLEEYSVLRSEKYDRGRVHYFMQCFLAQKPVPYIVLDSNVATWEPIIIDGRHRAVAAVHAGVERLNVSFSGLTMVENYCIGRRKTNPLC